MGPVSRWLGQAILLLAFPAFVFAQRQRSELLQVDEPNIRFHLLPKPQLDLPVINLSSKPVAGNYRLELLDEQDQVSFAVAGSFHENPGPTMARIPIDAGKLPTDSPSHLGWFRMRYNLTPKSIPESVPVQGVVQLGPLIQDAFALRITGAEEMTHGSSYPVRVRVDNPITRKPLAGFAVAIRFEIDDQETVHKTTTDSSGYAVTQFRVPETSSDDDATVTATVTRGDFTEEKWFTAKFPRELRVTLSTDKPIYQPGQTLHMRILAFDPESRALGNSELRVKIQDHHGQLQYEKQVTTSKFGVATADWEIPQKIQLGEYSISADVQSSSHYNRMAMAQVRISRYELPSYTVQVKPDRTYYLPGQNATVEVRASYLFGKPLQRAKVKLVKQSYRRWDDEKQRWVAEESEPLEGEFDTTGKFVAHLSLKRDFASFNESQYERNDDLSYAAYVTDLSTGRTEQRRFRLRLSAQPIHLYVSHPSVSAGEPLTIYVTSFYPDGTPASVTGDLEGALPDEGGVFPDEPKALPRTTLGHFHTNRYGVARVALPRIPDNMLGENGNGRRMHSWDGPYWWGGKSTEKNEFSLMAVFFLHGSDQNGRRGETQSELDVMPGKDYIRVTTDHALYHPGDPVQIKVATNSMATDMVVDLLSDKGLVSSQLVRPIRGKAELTVPYDAKFRGHITVRAYAMMVPSDENYALSGVASIIYPAREELQISLRMNRSVLRPGETAKTALRVTTPDGKPVESALGVLVYDRAVAERVRTDEEFGRSYGFWLFDYLPNYYPPLGDVSYRDLLNLDSDQPFPDGIDLVAEEILNNAYEIWQRNVSSAGSDVEYSRHAPHYFEDKITDLTKRVEEALNKTYRTSSTYPKTAEDLRTELRKCGINPNELRDPWNVAYRLLFTVRGPFDLLTLVSSGLDKQPGTADDFEVARHGWPYYRKTGELIDITNHDYFRNSGKYIRDYATLRDELQKKNFDLDKLRDPWGHPYSYSFEIKGPYFQIRVESPGPDGRFDAKASPSWDDVREWTSSIHYFQQETADLERALAEHFAATKKFPENEDELKPVLRAAGLGPEKLTDLWGHPYRFNFTTSSRYWDRFEISTVSVYGEQPLQRTTQVTPVTQQLAYIQIVSDGPPSQYPERFPVAEFSRVIAEQSSKDISVVPAGKEAPRSNGNGGITGTVTDPSGAVIPHVNVTAVAMGKTEYTAVTDENGIYTFANIPTGIYRLVFVGSGFREHTVLQVPVQTAGTTRIDVTLMVGAAAETVEVTAVPSPVEMSVSAVVARKAEPVQSVKPMFTPRLRQYFPETLLWQPGVITDERGRAQINFAMADNITDWKMSVIASNLVGQVGIAEKALQTFQPFFIEHDPPKVLTEGDRVDLPIVLRNYSAKSQSLEAELRSQPWFSALAGTRKTTTVGANSDATVIFPFRAERSVRQGMQVVSARNAQIGDAVKKEILVHPNGHEIFSTVAQVIAGEKNSLTVQIPEAALPNSIDAELRIYPNLIAHVLDAMRGMGQRPAGCVEQITSSGYVNMLALKLLRKANPSAADLADAHAQLADAAAKSLQQAYDEVITQQNADGGFSYWRGQSSDLALTAYVLRFISQASDFITVETTIITRGTSYLVHQQSKSGAWMTYDKDKNNRVEDLNLTAYIARAMAMVPTRHRVPPTREELPASLKAAMTYLEGQIDIWKDAYLVGNYAVAAAASGNTAYIARAEKLLASLAHHEGPTTYWNLEANTSPFYGWGTAGRLETTALAVEALAIAHPADGDPLAQEVDRGLQYLLNHRDHYSVWWSTQATQNVIEAIAAAIPVTQRAGGASEATLVVNGTTVSTLHLPSPEALVGPVTVNVAQYLHPGSNTVQIRKGNSSAINALLVTSYYIHWSASSATHEENFESGDTRALRLNVQYDHTEAKSGENIHCRVHAERLGFQGYGMMVAEVGLVPGAELDRATLENMRESGLINAYELQPDRVVFYLWPAAGGSDFEFQFRLRYAIDAMSSQSILYDYYNPEASATVMPVRITAR